MGWCRPKTAIALNEMFSNEGGANNRCDGSPIYIWLPKHTCFPAASTNRAFEVSMRNDCHKYLHTTYNSGGIMLLVACCPVWTIAALGIVGRTYGTIKQRAVCEWRSCAFRCHYAGRRYFKAKEKIFGWPTSLASLEQDWSL